LSDGDALVLDLRGGWGGASPSYLNIFTENSIEAQSVTRMASDLLTDYRDQAPQSLYGYQLNEGVADIQPETRTLKELSAARLAWLQ
jgi:hypothetical protein